MTSNSVITDIILEDEAWGDEGRWQSLADRAVAATLGHVPHTIVPGTELALVLTNDEDIQELNREHRDMDKPTNVLSFPQHEPDDEIFGPLLGDIIIARETVIREAEEASLSLEDHTAHMIVHGLLHLLGYDHIDPEEAEEMEALERLALADLGIKDPYADSVPSS